MPSRCATTLAFAAALIVLATPPAAGAQTTLFVNTTADASDGTCDATPAGCSLRDAVDEAVAGSTINVPAGAYSLTLGELLIDDSVSIVGAGARTTVISAGGLSRVALVSGSTTVAAISGMTTTGGNGTGTGAPTGQGGALYVGLGATLTLTGSTVSGNTANALGGGIYSRGKLVVTGSTVTGNHAPGTVTVGQGGGIYQAAAANPPGFSIIGASTISGNTAGSGGGIAAAGTLRVDRSTIAGNTAASGSGLLRGGGSTLINDTIVAGAAGTACAGDTAPITGNHNLSGDASCGFTDTGDRPNADPLLGALQNNGGPTDTQALGAASPAIGAANPSTCTGADQRGVVRPQQGTCDIGAFEYIAPPPPPPIEPQPPPPVAGQLVNGEPKGGTVKIKMPGHRHFRVLRKTEQIPVGTVIDTRKGRIGLIAAANGTGGTASADFYDGLFRLGQTNGSKPITTLKLIEKLSCGHGRASAAAKKKKKKRHLWGDGKGRFRTSGSYSSATVRGTKWLVEDRCASTLTRAVHGRVAVRDFVKHKTVIVRAGRRYRARRK